MELKVFFTVLAVLTLALLKTTRGDLEPVLQSCCSSGEVLARNQTTCAGSGDVAKFPPQDRLTCLTAIYICCIRTHRQIHCENGKNAARTRKQCSIHPQQGGEAFKDCCDACTLGLQAESMQMPCTFSSFSFGLPWDEAFQDCCQNPYSPLGTSPEHANFSPGNGNCGADNPCDQKCEEIGQGVRRCSCYPGYKLTVDLRTCEDIDECLLEAHNCDPATETCLNSIGGFQCLEKTLPIADVLKVACPVGYEFNQDRRTCDDVDECQAAVCPRGFLCMNTKGSYRCLAAANATADPILHPCPRGFQFHTAAGRCIDLDECAEGIDTCDRTIQMCQNSHGSYQCLEKPTRNRNCPAGFKWNGNKDNCEDVDECEEGTHTCDPNTQECLNAVGSFRCISKVTCPYGYRWVAWRRKCEDINECMDGDNDCDRRTQMCINTPGSYQCQTRPGQVTSNCGTGYVYDASRDTCTDLNECDILRPCRNDQVCENTPGSYRCVCSQGFTLDTVTKECKDVNECQLQLHSCAESQRCDNTIGSYTCVRTTSCGTGYTLNAATSQCEDDDECLLGTHNCGPGFECRNTLGSFRCHRVKCPSGQKLLSDGTCKVITCGTGMEHDDDGNCIDINECARNPPCRLNQRCINTAGSYRCQNLLNCGSGYELNEVGDQCVDVDECERRIAECGPGQTCRNRQGGYICECPRGYSLSPQRVCEDIDECSRFRGQVCASNSECINTQGSYTCNCNDGFRAGGTDKSCVDIDECAEQPNICQQTCNNVWGSYQCSCKLGYTLAPDERSCQDINECEVYGGIGSLCIGFCVNEPGSFKCSCPNGYRLSSDGRTCQDIDECQEQNICNDDRAVCLNTRGGYKCNRIECPPNYVRDKDHRNEANSKDTVVCRKRCGHNDVDCILNETQTITFQTLALPTVPFLPQPLILTTMRAVATSSNVHFSTDYRILEGNERQFFDILKGQGVGSLRLTRAINGPDELFLKILMIIHLNPNPRLRFTSTTQHLAYINVIVSQYDF
ncbi:fibulin-1-like isoform X4 [Argiope bruennichi]|uniref:fibulin-1-like isoform X4 n=1 Tax=Argiope bruennichi TaxID=94029 RepID=UPI0024944DC6|nr:fibulin-1-like isoform X4 [Argiope bruennichi]